MAISPDFEALVASVQKRARAPLNWSVMLSDRVRVALSNTQIPGYPKIGVWYPVHLSTARPLPYVSVEASINRTTVNGLDVAVVTNTVIVYSAMAGQRTTIATNLLSALKATYNGDVAAFSSVNGTSGGKYIATIRIAQKL